MMKKGSVFTGMEIPLFLPKLIIITLTVIVVILGLSIFYFKELDLSDVEGGALSRRFFYSEDCMAYSDGERVYPGIIDLQKFNQERLKRCYENYEEGYGFNFILKNSQETNIREIKATNIPIELCDVESKNFGCFREKQYILYYENGKINGGTVLSTVILYGN